MKRIAALLLLALAGWAQAGTLGLHIGSQHYPARNFNDANPGAYYISDEGWAVDYVTEATLTFDMTTPAGATLTAAQLRERTETVLAGRFATIRTVNEVLA